MPSFIKFGIMLLSHFIHDIGGNYQKDLVFLK